MNQDNLHSVMKNHNTSMRFVTGQQYLTAYYVIYFAKLPQIIIIPIYMLILLVIVARGPARLYFEQLLTVFNVHI